MMKHKDKVKMARKMLTTKEKRTSKTKARSPIFLSSAWNNRRDERAKKELNRVN